MHNNSKETNQKPASGFLIAHFKRSLVSKLEFHSEKATHHNHKILIAVEIAGHFLYTTFIPLDENEESAP